MAYYSPIQTIMILVYARDVIAIRVGMPCLCAGLSDLLALLFIRLYDGRTHSPTLAYA